MKFQELDHDDAFLQELGKRLVQFRIDQNLSQAELAKRAGVGKRTLERLETGETTQTRTLFRIFRELDLLRKIEIVFPEPTARPSRVIKETKALPKRVSRKRADKEKAGQWKWGDEV
jgi:transcriptional regulator with XRE-family HTH domain